MSNETALQYLTQQPTPEEVDEAVRDFTTWKEALIQQALHPSRDTVTAERKAWSKIQTYRPNVASAGMREYYQRSQVQA